MTIGNDARPHVVIDNHLNHTRAPREAPNKASAIVHALISAEYKPVRRYAAPAPRRAASLYILVERHAMYNTIFRINNSRKVMAIEVRRSSFFWWRIKNDRYGK